MSSLVQDPPPITDTERIVALLRDTRLAGTTIFVGQRVIALSRAIPGSGVITQRGPDWANCRWQEGNDVVSFFRVYSPMARTLVAVDLKDDS